MGLNVALIDQSEIIRKMLSHSLHYFAADVHRYEDLSSFPPAEDFDLIFVDWELKEGKRPLALILKEKAKKTPVIALHRESADQILEDFPHHLKKPIDANMTREMAVRLSPKAQKLKLHKFLAYPSAQNATEMKAAAKARPNENNENAPLALETSAPEKTALAAPGANEAAWAGKKGASSAQAPELSLQTAKDGPGPGAAAALSSQSNIQREDKAAQEKAKGGAAGDSGFDLPSLSSDEKEVIAFRPGSRPALSGPPEPAEKEPSPAAEEDPESTQALEAPQNEGAAAAEPEMEAGGGAEQTATAMIQQEEPETALSEASAAQAPAEQTAAAEAAPEPSEPAEESSSLKPSFQKDNIDLDENTQNDLGPAALVNSLRESKEEKRDSLSQYQDSGDFKELVQSKVAEVMRESGQKAIEEAIVKNNKGFIEGLLKECVRTLEFEKAISESLKEYGAEAIQSLFESHKREIIEKSIAAYTESDRFKSFVEEALKAFIEESLVVRNQIKETFQALSEKEAPRMARNYIRSEIKRLLCEEEEREGGENSESS